MLYAIFLYQSTTGLLLWQKSFEKDLSPEKLEYFSSFFTALQSFVTQIIIDPTKELNKINMGNVSINITTLTDLNLKIVAIADDSRRDSRHTPRLPWTRLRAQVSDRL